MCCLTIFFHYSRIIVGVGFHVHIHRAKIEKTGNYYFVSLGLDTITYEFNVASSRTDVALLVWGRAAPVGHSVLLLFAAFRSHGGGTDTGRFCALATLVGRRDDLSGQVQVRTQVFGSLVRQKPKNRNIINSWSTNPFLCRLTSRSASRRTAPWRSRATRATALSW